jgi:hypothetical protein
MNDSRVVRRRPLAWSPVVRTAFAVVLAAALGLLGAACGGGSPRNHVAQLGSTTATTQSTSSSSTVAGSAKQNDPVAFSRCMRTNGVRNFPDPNSSGAIPKVGLQQLGVSSSQFQAAQRACQHLLPNSGQSSPAQVQQVMNALSRFARCVRSHGVSNWPDPLAESDAGQPGTPGFPRSMPGINQSSPLVKSAMGACQHLLAGIGYGSGGYP